MIRYITRHGQVAKTEKSETEKMFAFGRDVVLSELGKEQADLLGKKLARLDFHGRIICSPYKRTLETAVLIAKHTGSKIYPFAPIREMEKPYPFRDGLSLKEIRQQFPYIDPEAELDDCWWSGRVEEMEDVFPRVEEGVKWIEAHFAREPLLFVGHGASTHALSKAYGLEEGFRKLRFNCSLTRFDTEEAGKDVLLCDVSHMPYEKTTSNFLTREEYDAEYFAEPWQQEIVLPEGVDQIKGTKILHIGDTNSDWYPYFMKLIQVVKPDVILHTGDTADEVKVGRIPGTEYEYLTKIKVLLEAMERSGARLIFVSGNNDLPEEIHKMVPKMEIYPANSVLELDGVECRVGHRVMDMTFDKNWTFYGHGLTGEVWHYEDNQEGKPCRFNTTWGSFVYCLSEGKFFHLPLPELK